MQTFTYSFFYKFVFRFGNIFVTVLLLLHLVPVVYNIDQNILLLLPLVISIIIIYVVNKNYLNYYKLLPYKIEADEEKMICSNFLFSKRVVTIRYEDIELLRGGIFDGKLSGILKVGDGKNNVQIGFSQKINSSGKLISLILSKVSKELYNRVIDHLTEKGKGKNPRTR